MPIFPGAREGNFAARQVHIDDSLRARVIIKIDERQAAGAVSVQIKYGWFSREVALSSNGETLKIGRPVELATRDVIVEHRTYPPSVDSEALIASSIPVGRPDNVPPGSKTLTEPGEHLVLYGGGPTIIVTAPPSTMYIVVVS